jgi:segregation and condensation protein B
MTLDAKIEAILFWKAEAVPLKKLAEICEVSIEEINESIIKLEDRLSLGGLCLIKHDEKVLLGTRKEASQLIEKLTKEELIKDLGKAGLETIAIVLYQGPLSRADIDYIRGVNSNFILRNLLIRGLIEKIPNPKDQRSFHYKPTTALLAHLGIEQIESLPEFQTIKNDIENFKNLQNEDNKSDVKNENTQTNT